MVTPSWVRFFGLQYTWGSEEGNWNAFRHKPFPEIALLPNLFPWSVQLNNFHDDWFKAFRHVVCVFEPWKCMPEIRRRHWYVPPPARWRQCKPNWALLNDDWVNLSSRGDRLNPRLKTAAVNCIRYTWSCATLDKCEIKSWTMHQENVWPFAVVHTSCRKPAVTTNPMSGNPVVVTLYMSHVNWIGPMVENMKSKSKYKTSHESQSKFDMLFWMINQVYHCWYEHKKRNNTTSGCWETNRIWSSVTRTVLDESHSHN